MKEENQAVIKALNMYGRVPKIWELLEEIERLQNIIKELEKWLEKQHQFIIEIPAFTKEISIEHKTMELCYENILDKLQELKGSDKNEKQKSN